MEYILMNKKTPVARITLDEATGIISDIKEMLNAEYLPVGIPANGDEQRAALAQWWQARSIPVSRSGLRDALALLGVPSPTALLHKCYGLSLSDQYWINPAKNSLSWEDINFFDNAFSEDIGNALFGSAPLSEQIDWFSPCSTSDGWLKKKWKIINGQRCLIKGGSGTLRQEPLNEQVASLILEKLGIAYIPYSVVWENDEPYSLCADFITRDTELVPMMNVFKVLPRNADEPLLQHLLHCCDTLGIPNAKPFLVKMLTVDALIANTDRHLGNFGAIRNVETLEWVGMAPVYDNGTSLWHKEITARITPDAPVLCRPFAKTHAAQLTLLHTDFSWLNFHALSNIQEEAFQILSTSYYLDEARCMAISGALAANAARLRELSRTLQKSNRENYR